MVLTIRQAAEMGSEWAQSLVDEADGLMFDIQSLVEEPQKGGRFESYYGLVLATPLASCSGCKQIVLYRTANDDLIEAGYCRCVSESDV